MFRVNPPGGVGSFANILAPHQIVYGDEYAYINGTNGLAEVRIVGHMIPHQAFINVTEEKQYAAVQYMAKHPVFPGEARSWHVLTEGVAANGAPIAWPANDTTTPAGTTRVLLDTGTTNILVPPEIRDAIYAAVPGAILARNSSIANHYWCAESDVWVVPCGTAVGFTYDTWGRLKDGRNAAITGVFRDSGKDNGHPRMQRNVTLEFEFPDERGEREALLFFEEFSQTRGQCIA
ncbi:hypothetical protein DFH09DRAFT_1090022 [Mycena vulgaris]|nr:hypothetical protein DFH09DRAFT_1090022 [Mycena vulgaris]